MVFISGVQYYIPIKLCKTTGSIHLFKITGTLKPENLKLNWNYIRDTLEIDWKEVNATFNSNNINLPKTVIINFRDKFKIRCTMKTEILLFHTMLKQGITWFTLVSNTQETVQENKDTFPEWISNLKAHCNFDFHCAIPKDTVDMEMTIWMVDGIYTYRRDQTTQMTSYSPWGRQVKPFSSLRKNITDYKEQKKESHEKQNSNPFTPVRENKSGRKKQEIAEKQKI